MNTNPLFSVLIANYNNGKYLMDAINSVYAQTYTNWEIILVDDASTDNSKELYKELEKDSRIHIFYNEENKGCGYTKRRCAELANGELCGFLDPDDMLLPKALELMVGVHTKYEDVAIVYSRCYLCDEKYEPIGKNNLLKLKEGESFFDYRWYGAMHLVAYKKVFYDKTEGISANIKAGVDQDLYFKVEEVGKIYVLDEFTYKYVIKRSTAITSFSNRANLFYWNLVVRKAACLRRGLDCDSIICKDFGVLMNSYAESIMPQLEKEKIEAVYGSHSYRLGNFILTPLIWLKRLIKKIK